MSIKGYRRNLRYSFVLQNHERGSSKRHKIQKANLGGGDGAGDFDAEVSIIGGGGEGSFCGPSLPEATRKATSKAETAERLQVRALVST